MKLSKEKKIELKNKITTAGINQKDVADFMGVTSSYLSDILNQNIDNKYTSNEMIIKIENAIREMSIN